MSPVVVEARRGALVESVHRVHVAVAGADGRIVAGAGETERVAFARSAIKPLQALPLVEDGAADALGLTDREIALCCASHGGEPFHVEAARSILARAGVAEDDLACGAHAPFHAASAAALAAAGAAPGRIHNNCSGKHGGMLALARHHGWPTAGYHEAAHPVQQRMLAELARWSAYPAEWIGVGVDGCGICTFALPLSSLARAFARFGAAAETGGRGEGGAAERAAARVVRAMARHPEYVAGTDRLCTELARATGGRVLAKVGAEGVYGAMAPAAGIGVALKAEDGATRAAETALLGVLRALDLVGGGELGRLERWAEPTLRNTRGEPVGRLRATVELERGGG